jgi:hypothetical protein
MHYMFMFELTRMVWILFCTVATTSTSQGERRLNIELSEDFVLVICRRMTCSM